MSRRGIVLVIAGLLAAMPAGASAASLTFVRDGNVYVAGSDGSGARAITADGSASAPYMAPSEDDHGVVVAQRGSLFVRLDQQGRRLGTLTSILAGKPGQVSGFGPFSPRVSPDGTRIAYFVGFLSGSYDPGCDCTLTSDREDVVVAPTDGSSTGTIVPWWRSPSWADDQHLVMAAPGNRQTAQIGFADMAKLGDGYQGSGWFSDDGQPMVDLDEPEVARGLDRMAAVRGMAGEGLALYTLAADGSAARRCELRGAAGSYQRPAFSPDGRLLTYADKQGVWELALPDGWADDCGSLRPTLIAPGAGDAGWSAAPLAPPADGGSSGAPSSGSSPAAGGPPAVRAITVTMLRIRADRTRTVGLSVALSEPAGLQVAVARCGRDGCRIVRRVRRAADRHHAVGLRRLTPGRYRVTIEVDGGPTAGRTVRIR